MNRPIVRHLGFALVVLVVALLIPTFIIAQGVPLIPHPLEGRDDCLGCHGTGIAEFPKVPADHAGRTNDLCQGCHQSAAEATSAPALVIPAIPHPLEGRDDCLVCHEFGVVGATQIPGDHAGRTNDMCQGCHQPATEAAPPAAPPNIPHPLEGRDDCLGCHGTGLAGFPQVPADHAGRTNDLCQGCHQSAAETGAVPPAASPAAPPGIPHPLEGRDDCLACHGAGIAGVPQTPDDHAGRTNDLCQGCHQPITEAAPAAEAPAFPLIPHLLEGRDNCLDCHGTGLAGFPQVPANHAGRTDDVCQSCHQLSPEVAHATGPSPFPPIPHPLEARDECLACHETGAAGAPQIPSDHVGRPNNICQGCHQPEAPASVRKNCLDCHILPEGSMAPEEGAAAGGVPTIPHALERHDDCLACHQDGVGGAPRIPGDHADRTNDVCQTCHQPGPVSESQAPAEPVPTPIALYPWPEKVNTCFDCHSTLGGKQADIADQWQRSIHAERNVACADCHGGDPTLSAMEASMSPDANFVGVPAKSDIPALCASCHADVPRMRQYDLPTDQWAKYKESTHGFQLSQGDRNVPTCFDCHGGHQVLKANDPASTVYPSNVPDLCASCHADETIMAGYNIPTDQFDLYRQSVHGLALLDNQDFRAPNCATCHGTHGAAPPGFAEVANICGSCHTATQDYYLKSPHANAGYGAPKCVTCHGRYDVSKPSEAIFVGAGPRHCGACHPPDSAAGRVAQSLYDTLTVAAQAYEEAEAAVQTAQRVGMLVTPLEGRLREANTSLIIARAAQHTLDPDSVRALTDDVQTIADEVKASADAAVAESLFRRRAMIIAVAVIGLVITALFLLKRELERQLDTESYKPPDLA